MPIILEAPGQPDVLALIEALDAYQKPLYPAESHHGIDLNALSQPNVLFAVVRDDTGRAVGCGGIALERDYGELKRMFVDPQQRGKGLAKALLAFLEAEAMQRGCRLFTLETGYLQDDALGLYARAGYERCGPFGDYAEDPNSVFMRKAVG
ncbi:GNAT family N-acetyltransferase [Aquincola sp. S2]|uniref:GNAT family N-acetyltransferase n=1 Tax=Pseudaquabacterium terrae TaxID=2732868 RepID=A0ABX2EI26_9BURK|nr:GNAT family N-acetyltransferase [Aquabacterium terrae]NRF68236.1 GNAT family N-acetyltransferase [Aquabacterium terrae]